MPAIAESKPKDQSIVAALGDVALPLELDRTELFGRLGPRPVEFRFTFREVPFSCTAERREGHPVLTLTGDLGSLPYTAEGAERRQAVQTVVAAARRRSGLDWQVTAQQQIVVRGGISLVLPLTPVAMVAGAVTLLLRARPFLDLLLEAMAQEG
ncbi:MAG TPA: hypothetical protein VN823_06215 [Stellaceae bacterium]|nr:hypothetical protein [Stellaceae bacterium]